MKSRQRAEIEFTRLDISEPSKLRVIEYSRNRAIELAVLYYEETNQRSDVGGLVRKKGCHSALHFRSRYTYQVRSCTP